MKLSYLYRLFWFCVPLILFSCSQSQKKKLPSLEETYRYDDKNPFGGYKTYNRISTVFKNVQITNVPLFDFEEEAEEDSGHYSLYIVLTKRLILGDAEADFLLKYIRDGNDLLISADYIDERFLEKIGCETNQKISHLQDQWGNMRETHVGMFFGDKLPIVPFGYYYYPFNNYLRKYQQDNTRVLGVNDQSLPNFVIIFLGKGRLYLHVAPRALSNYFLLEGDNREYLDNVLSYLRLDPSVVYWDEYFKNMKPYKDENKGFSALSVVMQHPVLKWAFWLVIFGIAFFIFSNIKRKQKDIPVQPEQNNATVDFVETIGRLYFANKNNKNIANKLITYFKESVRNKYFIRNFDNKESLARSLAGKRGMPLEDISELLGWIETAEQSETVSDETLIALNKKLENFYNTK